MIATVDARGLRCPWPVLRLARAMTQTGETLIMVEDSQAVDEIILLANARDWQIARIDGGMVVRKRAP